MKKLFDLEIYQSGDVNVTGTSCGDILISPSGGGRFYGELLSGRVIPIGAGTTTTLVPGESNVNATMLLETDSGETIVLSIKAYFDINPELEKLLENGEYISPDEYYYMGTVEFKTGSKQFKWLERKVFVCSCIIESWEKLLFSVFSI